MGVIRGPSLRKGRWSKSEQKRERRRAELDAATEYKKALKARDGTMGAAALDAPSLNRHSGTARGLGTVPDDRNFDR